MSLLSQRCGGVVFTGLLALLGSWVASESSAQSTRSSRPAAARPGTAVGQRPASDSARPARLASSRKMEPADEIVEGATYHENERGQLVLGAGPAGEPSFGADACDSGGACDDCGLDPCCCYYWPVFRFDNLQLFSGVQGFTGPSNRGSTGSFGFQEGVNWGTPFPLFPGLGMQWGARCTQSNLAGAAFTADSRHQVFVTGGLFHRVDCGLQGGVVVDYLNDDWYRDAGLVNLRAELSWMLDGVDDIGCWVSLSTGGVTATSTVRDPTTGVIANPVERWEGTDLYAFFFRRQFGDCLTGDARLFGGFSGHGDGLIGVDADLPLSDAWALETNLIYLIPKEGKGLGLNAGHAQESWNLGLSLVWYPGRAWRCGGGDSYNRPLFRVADNGIFMIDHRP